MKSVVIDTSVVIKWFLPERGGGEALKLRDNLLNKKIKICSRDLLLHEFTSAFKNYKIKLVQNDFIAAVKILRALKLSLYPLDYSELGELFSISKKLDISIYDCSYLLLARKLKSPLYTADRKLFLGAKRIISAVFIS